MSQYPPAAPPAFGFKPHRGTTILVLGILSLIIGCVGWIMGIMAWTMGNADLREMDAGRMDSSGRSVTHAGKVCGMISVILHLAGLAIWLIWMVFVVGIMGAAAAAGSRGP
jgi:hypothetical protein